MSNPRNIRVEYQAKNNATGLTDVKAQVYLNGVAKAVGGSALSLSEVDATNQPGMYELLIPSATLIGWGVAAGAENTISGSISSVSTGGRSPFRQQITFYTEDEIMATLGTPAGASLSADIAAIEATLGAPAGASVSSDIAAVKADTAAIKSDLETGSSSLATILANIQTLQNASIANGVGYVLPNMLIPATGANSYRVPLTIQNEAGALVDPASNTITVGVLNVAGTDRGSYLTGSSGTPAQVLATRDGVGQYHVMIDLPSTAPQEELLFSFAYTIGANAMVRYGQALVSTDVNAAGYALQSTLLATKTAVDAIKADVEDATNGLAAIKAVVADSTYGNAALQAMLANGTYGLAALKAEASSIEGSGFVSSTDSLHAISQYLSANVFVGGRAV